jgi:hypothetical protein
VRIAFLVMTQVALFTSSLLVEQLDSERSRPFVTAIHDTYEAAAASPGYLDVRRTAPETDVDGVPVRVPYDVVPPWYDDEARDRVVQTLSLWASVEDVRNYVYRSAHLGIYRQRSDFMTPPSHAQYVLWHTDSTTVPSLEEGVRRLVLLQEGGTSDEAFTFARQRDPHSS